MAARVPTKVCYIYSKDCIGLGRSAGGSRLCIDMSIGVFRSRECGDGTELGL